MMDCSVFPSVKQHEFDAALQQDLKRIERNHEDTLKNLKIQRQSQKVAAPFKWIVGILLAINVFSSLFGIFIVGPLVLLNFVGDIPIFIILLIVYLIVRAKRLPFVDVSQDKTYLEQCAAETERKNTLIENRMKQANEEYNDYLNRFEDEARQAATAVAQSALALRLVELMTERFKAAIENADRRAHVRVVSVVFPIAVYRDLVEYDGVKFDFDIERCEKLSDPLTQAALARALASNLNLQIQIAFPEDPAGNTFMLTENYSYQEDHLTVTMIYSSVNGDYQAVQSWTDPE